VRLYDGTTCAAAQPSHAQLVRLDQDTTRDVPQPFIKGCRGQVEQLQINSILRISLHRMAEIVAATAAIVQFADVAFRLTTHLGHLCSEVRHVPDRFRRLQSDLLQQVELAKLIQANCLPEFAATVASSTVDAFLLEYIGLINDLGRTLEKLLAKKDNGPLRRVWSGFCSARKKEDVERICERLEEKKSTLTMWLSAANLCVESRLYD
jgi:hypothetical protein